MISRFKISVLTLLFLLISVICKSQIAEVGFGIGGFTYTGDLQRGYDLSHNRPAFTAFFRSNPKNELSIKIGTTFGLLKDSDKNPIDPFALNRNAEFDIFIFEVATFLEYHFLDFKVNSYLRWSPYAFVGIGLFAFTGESERSAEFSNIQATIPFGVGLKYILNPKWILGAEIGPRKTFFDYIDNVSEGDFASKNFQYGNKNDNDLYYFLGVTLSYSFYRIPCPYPNY